MKKVKTLFALTLTLSALSAFGTNDSRSFLKAAQSSGWGAKYGKKPVPKANIKRSEKPVSTQNASKACTRDDQNSIPYKFFSEVLLGGKTLDISHNPATGKISLAGGAMISNCNDMIEYNFIQPAEGTPYAFQVQIKKPRGKCEKDEDGKLGSCSYDVTLAEGGLATGEPVKKKFKPTFDGFLQCLTESGVFKDGEIQEDKLAVSDFNFTGDGAHQTSELMFMSHGPEAAHQGGGLYSENERPGLGCYYYEKISEDGRTLYSQADIERNRKKVLFNKICRSGDYKLIDNHLPDFAQFKSMHAILKQIRNQLLEEENKNLHNLLKSDNYAGLDAEDFQRISSDFYKNIISPKREEIATLYNRMLNSPDQKVRNGIQKRIDGLSKELIKYTKAPYLNDGDRTNMKSFAKKSPLEKEAWREAAIISFASSNSAYHYSRYASDSKLGKLSTGDANNSITEDIRGERVKVEKLGALASDPSKSFAREAKNEIQYLQVTQKQNSDGINRLILEEVQHAQQVCPRQNYTAMNVQMCQQDAMYEIQRLQAILAHSDKGIAEDMKYFSGQVDYWSGIEAQRNTAYNVRPAQNQNQKRATGLIFEDERRDRRSIDFNFTPRNRTSQAGQTQMTMDQRQLQLLQQGQGSQNLSFINNGRVPANQQQQYMWQQQQRSGQLPAAMIPHMSGQTNATGAYQFRY